MKNKLEQLKGLLANAQGILKEMRPEEEIKQDIIKKLHKIAMYHNNPDKAPMYRVEDVLEILK